MILFFIVPLILGFFGFRKRTDLNVIIIDLHSDYESVRLEAIADLQKYKPSLKEQLYLVNVASK